MSKLDTITECCREIERVVKLYNEEIVKCNNLKTLREEHLDFFCQRTLNIGNCADNLFAVFHNEIDRVIRLHEEEISRLLAMTIALKKQFDELCHNYWANSDNTVNAQCRGDCVCAHGRE